MEASFRRSHTDIAYIDFLIAFCSFIQTFFLKLTTLSSFDKLSIPVFYIKGSIIQFCWSAADGEDGGLYIGKNK